MNRKQLFELFAEHFGGVPDYPWEEPSDAAVFRHSDNRKWYALVMNIPSEKLGIQGNGNIDIVNFKCDPAVKGSYLALDGFYTAYHMNKTHWITADIAAAADEDILSAAELSYALTMKKQKPEKK